MLKDFDLAVLIGPLEEWFRENARVLPWREEPTAYYVWVSEIMLQQTRVEAVKPYFARFVRELPDVEALAQCPEDRYLKLWEGLGYYSRVRNLHAAAVQVVEEYGGVIPADFERLLKLKGIGRYTAGAIASIAYNQPVPAVDGNVLRVLARVSADDQDIAKQSVRAEVERRLAVLMRQYAFREHSGGRREDRLPLISSDWSLEGPVLHPRIFNQALMELGALVCLPNGEPHCADCPWQDFCEARRQGRTAELPVKARPKERRIEDKTVLVIRDGDRIALHKREEKGLLAGLYELPNCEGHMTAEETCLYLKSLGYAPGKIQPLGDAKHVFSHVEWHMVGYLVLLEDTNDGDSARMKSDEGQADNFLFVEREEARNRYAIPNAFAQYFKESVIDRQADGAFHFPQ